VCRRSWRQLPAARAVEAQLREDLASSATAAEDFLSTLKQRTDQAAASEQALQAQLQVLCY
jgi:hypothetical protein